MGVERGMVPPLDERDALRTEEARLKGEVASLQRRLEQQQAEVDAVRRLNRELVRENNRLRSTE